jgi:transcription-repair coupling factor (superfamily II helicase)
MPVMIPEHYVPDLQRAHAALPAPGRGSSDGARSTQAGAELIDRFGPLPPEVEALLKVILVKALCRTANVEKVEAGPKGAVGPSW